MILWSMLTEILKKERGRRDKDVRGRSEGERERGRKGGQERGRWERKQ